MTVVAPAGNRPTCLPGTAVDSAGARLAIGARVLGVDFPLVQAGMGGVAGPALAAAVGEAGALGTVACYRSTPERVARLVRETGRLTRRRFAVGVVPELAGAGLKDQLSAALAVADRVLVVNSFGVLPAEAATALKAAGHLLLVQVGSAAEAATAIGLGADVLALQGTAAGGRHLGRLSTRRLLAEVRILGPGVPLLVAGGLTDGGWLHAAASAGAHGAVAGTLFVATDESEAHPDYRCALLAATAADTVVTDRFALGWPGRPHRVLAGPVTDGPEAPPRAVVGWLTEDGVRHPVFRGSATVPSVRVTGAINQLAHYAGTGCGAVRTVRDASAVVHRLRAEAAAATC
ncbi:nitronate monooxygenase [Streptomyces sp. NPDC093544]|uniref:NAD(P)H-dependent flavin oxidoreductase n=1 Tax=Streptomyces sp. NPDC093544 TaxID=3155200 RepID=UPI00342E75AB